MEGLLLNSGYTPAPPTSLSAASEDLFITAARVGDREAFNRLVTLYQDRMYNLAYRIMGDAAAADDATQDAFISAYRHLTSFQGGSFKSWLFRIVTNACYDALRSRKRRVALSLDQDDSDEHLARLAVAAQPYSPESIVQRRELADLLQRHIARLPADQRVVLVLRDVEGLSYQEIADVMHSKVGTVKSRLSRGRGWLRQHLTAQHPFFQEQNL